MADYGIFGHGSSGNSWFANSLDKFHGHTKKYDPLGHYSVEMPLKGAHWLVEKTSKGLADAGIGEGFNRRLNQEADENGNNFGLGSQRMGLGILSVLAGMYGAGAAGAGSAGGSAGGAAGGSAAGGGLLAGEAAPTALGYGLGGSAGYTLPASGGAAAGGGTGAGLGATYFEQGGGQVADMGNGFSWLNADGTSGMTGQLGQGGSSSLLNQLQQQSQGGSGGQQGGGQSGGPQGTMLGNPSLTAALAKLVEGDQKAKTQRERGLLPSIQYQETGFDPSSLTADDFQRLLAMYQQQQQNGGYDGGVA